MSETHWKKLINPDYLGAYSLDPGKDMILTIKQVRKEMITGTGGKQEECTVCHWAEDQKPMILNVTNCKMIAKLLKTPYIERWAGHRIQIGAEVVSAFGEKVEALDDYTVEYTLDGPASYFLTMLKDNFEHRKPALKKLDEDASKLPPASDGLIILPYFLGEKTPIFDPEARGMMFGLTLSHTRAHIFRACLEAVIYGFRHHIDVIRELGYEPRRIIATNGGSRSRFWCQIAADVLGQEARGPVVRLSRSHPAFVKRLFETEIPEIEDGSTPSSPNTAPSPRTPPPSRSTRSPTGSTATCTTRPAQAAAPSPIFIGKSPRRNEKRRPRKPGAAFIFPCVTRLFRRFCRAGRCGRRPEGRSPPSSG